jgi:hypothetical protein
MEDFKNFFNILFFVVMSVIAILSYLQARKTLFSPIKTEIFKVQIAAFQDVLKFFNRHSSIDFDRQFDVQKIFHINAAQLRLDYIHTFFADQIEPTETHINEIRNAAVGSLVSEEFLIAINEPGQELIEIQPPKKQELSPAMKLAKWNEYKYSKIDFTEAFQKNNEELALLAASPLLPTELTDLIYEFKAIMNHNLMVLGEVLTACAKQLPTKYSTADDVIKFNPNWIWNKYNSERKSTDEVVSKILKYINNYLKINEVMGKA